jgi:hypothetical protein
LGWSQVAFVGSSFANDMAGFGSWPEQAYSTLMRAALMIAHPPLDVGRLHRGECLGRLLLTREKLQPKIGEPCAYRQRGQSCGI